MYHNSYGLHLCQVNGWIIKHLILRVPEFFNSKHYWEDKCDSTTFRNILDYSLWPYSGFKQSCILNIIQNIPLLRFTKPLNNQGTKHPTLPGRNLEQSLLSLRIYMSRKLESGAQNTKSQCSRRVISYQHLPYFKCLPQICAFKTPHYSLHLRSEIMKSSSYRILWITLSIQSKTFNKEHFHLLSHFQI